MSTTTRWLSTVMAGILLAILGLGGVASAAVAQTAQAPFVHTVAAAANVPNGCRPSGPGSHWSGMTICVIQGKRKPGKMLVLLDGKTIKESLQYDRTVRTGNGPPSDGTPQHATRNGQHRLKLSQMHRNFYSKLYRVYMPYTMFFDGGEAVHYSGEFARGYPYSHGCAGLRDYRFAQWLWNLTRSYLKHGTPVHISVTGPMY